MQTINELVTCLKNGTGEACNKTYQFTTPTIAETLLWTFLFIVVASLQLHKWKINYIQSSMHIRCKCIWNHGRMVDVVKVTLSHVDVTESTEKLITKLMRKQTVKRVK